ncbi:tetratricopeptide repeat protein [Streptomyces sp. NPDC001820]|uniref:tetratricopeptide repeat protein n=1 Tax=Streptomyces sp. NPDC001820 TaxID=3364613 RepID=UPI0036CB88F2
MEERRGFPFGDSVSSIIARGEAALEGGDPVAAGNWFVHAFRLGSGAARVHLEQIAPVLERLLDDPREAAGASALLGGMHLISDTQHERALALFRQAAEAGAPDGMRGLGFMLAEGVGTTANRAEANGWFRRGAELGDGYCAYNMALAARDGLGMRRNAKGFLAYLHQAADYGIPEACALLADQYNSRDEEEDAFTWYLVAAQGGHVPAMWVVAARYEAGLGTAEDGVQAVRWLLQMMHRGNGDGFHEALRIARGMPADDVRRAGELADRTADADAILHVVGTA